MGGRGRVEHEEVSVRGEWGGEGELLYEYEFTMHR